MSMLMHPEGRGLNFGLSLYFQASFVYANREDSSASVHIPGLKLRVGNRKMFFLFLNQNICCGCSKVPSQ